MFPTYYAGFKEFHLPVPYLKSTFEEIWEKEPQLLEETRTPSLVPCASGHGGFQPPNRCAKRTGKR